MAIKSDAQRKAVAKYNKANYDQMQIRVSAGEKEKIKAHAESKGESLNAYVYRLIQEDMQKE